MNELQRRIFKYKHTGVETIKELIQSMFVGEFLLAGQKIWIVSPWISNVVLIDNRSGNFDTLNPEWGRKEIRLIDVLITFMSRGCHVVLVTRDKEKTNDIFLTSLIDMAGQHSLEDQLTVRFRDVLHTKGILLSKCLIEGSMNITYNGLVINDERITFSIDSEVIAQTRLEFEKYTEDT
jgi:phosphatidylserine/phosphatidylglycerophosphate/cardiolipin synthase-like enzyme